MSRWLSPAATAGNPALTLLLALFMLGYALWAADRLASPSRARDAAPAPETAQPSLTAVIAPAAAGIPGTPGPAATAHLRPGPGPALAPRLAACYKIAMAITMGYMLVTML